MKKILIAVVVLVVIGVGSWMAYPLFVNKEVDESLDDFITQMNDGEVTEKVNSGTGFDEDEQPVVIATGTFEGRAGHRGTGTVNLLAYGDERLIQFDGDFDIVNGPDLFVHLGANDEYSREANLGKLKGNRGSQIYAVPESYDLEDLDEVWVWCRAFSTPFVQATLTPVEDTDDSE